MGLREKLGPRILAKAKKAANTCPRAKECARQEPRFEKWGDRGSYVLGGTEFILDGSHSIQTSTACDCFPPRRSKHDAEAICDALAQSLKGKDT